MTFAVASAAVLAAADPSPTPAEPAKYIDPETVTPGVLGLVIFLFLAAATVLLWLSMNRQLKKITFDDDAAGPDDATDGSEPVVRLPSDSPGQAPGRS